MSRITTDNMITSTINTDIFYVKCDICDAKINTYCPYCLSKLKIRFCPCCGNELISKQQINNIVKQQDQEQILLNTINEE